MSVIGESRLPPPTRTSDLAKRRTSKVPVPSKGKSLIAHPTRSHLPDVETCDLPVATYRIPVFSSRQPTKSLAGSPRKASTGSVSPGPSPRKTKATCETQMQPPQTPYLVSSSVSKQRKTSCPEKSLSRQSSLSDASPKHSPYRQASPTSRGSALNMSSSVDDRALMSSADCWLLKPEASPASTPKKSRFFSSPFSPRSLRRQSKSGPDDVLSHETIMKEVRKKSSQENERPYVERDISLESLTSPMKDLSGSPPQEGIRTKLTPDSGKSSASSSSDSSPRKSKLFIPGFASPRKKKIPTFKSSLPDSSSMSLKAPFRASLRKSVSLETKKASVQTLSSQSSMESFDELSPSPTTPTTPTTPRRFNRTLSEIPQSNVAARRARLSLPGLKTSRIPQSPLPSPVRGNSYVENVYSSLPKARSRRGFFRGRHQSESAPQSPLVSSIPSPQKSRLSLSGLSSPKRLRSPSESPKKSSPSKPKFTFTEISPTKRKSETISPPRTRLEDLCVRNFDKDSLSGFLYVNILSGKGFAKNADLYCMLEIDSYGHFFKKSKTKPARGPDPQWTEDFELEVEACTCLRILCFNKLRLMGDEMCGRTMINLTRENLRDNKNHSLTVGLDRGQASISLSVSFSTTMDGIKKSKSFSDHGVFGMPIAVVCRREKYDIPVIVISCIKEIEKRGMEETGIYRLSGVASEIQGLKNLFNDSTQSALLEICSADIHAVAGLLKLYFRELPQSLFTSKLYSKFVEGLSISDPDDKELYMFDVFNQLPRCNRLTALYLFQHLKKVSELEKVNKMGINNLATVFGPTVLRPASSQDKENERNSLNIGTFDLGALDVMSQVATFRFFLSSKSEKLALPEDDLELWRRLDPEKALKIEEKLLETAEEYLI